MSVTAPEMDGLWLEPRHFIGGELSYAANGQTMAVINPATEQIVGHVADGDRSDMDRAIAAARSAFDDSAWRNDLKLRLRCLRQLKVALDSHIEDFRRTLIAEVGCPVSLTHHAQLRTPIEGIDWVIDLAESYQWHRDLGEAAPFGMRSRRYVDHVPYGVVGAITPWNFPVQIELAKVIPALAAGNTVVLKPAPDTPYSGLLLGRLILEETDMPPGVFNVVSSSAGDVGRQLCEDPRVDLISFTGSTATGRQVMAAASSTVKRVFLELGGKSAFVALDDADLQHAAQMVAFGITIHAGQGCATTTRLLLPKSRYDEGLEAVVAAISSAPYGDPTDPLVSMGPLINERQRQRVLGYIRSGIADGATLVTGGGVPAHLPRGYYVEPTVLSNVDPSSSVSQEEIFGPVLVVTAFDEDDEAVNIANNSIYGLSGAVMSASIDRARAVGQRIRSGTMGLNGGMYYGFDVPFGGSRQSGIGREMGVEGFEEYLEVRAVAEGLGPE